MKKKTCIDITTTSVGRLLITQTYNSFLQQLQYDGDINIIVSIDRTYGITDQECCETIAWLQNLPERDPRIKKVIIEKFPHNVGLQRALLVLFSHCREPYGINLEDDWEFTGPIHLNSLIEDLEEQNSTMIAFNSNHVSANGTFERQNEVETIKNSHNQLLRLLPPSWACDYLPLCPHLHKTEKWIPLYTKAMMLSDNPTQCPDERVKAFVRLNGLRESHNMLWTKDILVNDIGRDWMAKHAITKNIAPDSEKKVWPIKVQNDKKDPSSILLERSASMLKRADKIIPGTTQTFMKRPCNFSPGKYPAFVEAGSGSRIRDVDGNVYIDFVASLGATTLGYTPEAVNGAVLRQIENGTIFSLPTLLEIEAAEAIKNTAPNIEMVRFFKSGADAISAAVRLARYITKKEKILFNGYHGFHDLFAGQSPGVPAFYNNLGIQFNPYNTNSLEEELKKNRGEIAAVVLAIPYEQRMTPLQLQRIKNIVHKNGILLILDEIVTGFRLSRGGAQEYFNISADIICYGKALGAGMPISALCGSKEILKEMDLLHVSTTYGGEALSLATVIEVMKVIKHENFYKKLEVLGNQFSKEINKEMEHRGLEPLISGYPMLPYINIQSLSNNTNTEDEVKNRFLAITAKQGILLRSGVNFITAAHSDQDIEIAIRACIKAIKAIIR